MDANTLGYVMTVLTIGITWIAMRSSFFGLKLMAGMWWFVLFMYLKEKAPTAITEGQGVHTGLLVVCIGIGLMIVLSGLGRGIQRTEKWNEKQSEMSEGFHFKLPSWLKASEDSPEVRRQKTEENLTEYRDAMHRALHPSGKRRR